MSPQLASVARLCTQEGYELTGTTLLPLLPPTLSLFDRVSPLGFLHTSTTRVHLMRCPRFSLPSVEAFGRMDGRTPPLAHASVFKRSLTPRNVGSLLRCARAIRWKSDGTVSYFCQLLDRAAFPPRYHGVYGALGV